jgi:hypothetical protein
MRYLDEPQKTRSISFFFILVKRYSSNTGCCEAKANRVQYFIWLALGALCSLEPEFAKPLQQLTPTIPRPLDYPQ